MQITIKGGVYLNTRDRDFVTGGPRFTWFNGELRPFMDWVPVVEHKLVFSTPAGFSVQHECIAALERQRDELRAKFADDVRCINDQIANLQALTNEVAQ